jgi:glycosyltransferase involved in cell wall biosynthesis
VKLGIDCRDLLAGSLTGIGRFVGNLLRAISLQDRPPDLFLYGNQHTVFDLPETWGRPLDAETRRAKEAATWWWDRVTLPRLARQDHLDVFLSPYFKAPGIRSCPIATTIHDLLFLRMPPEVSGRSTVYCRAFRSFAASFARRAAVVLTVSKHSRRDIAELLDVPKKKIHVVGNCVGPNFRPVDEAAVRAAREACGVEGDYVLYVGNFGPHKNVEGLLRAFAGLDESLRAAHRLVLAGSEDRGAGRVRRHAQKLGVADRIVFTGHVPDEHLPALYAGAAAFATLSRWEGFGLPVLEAMACGTPVLGSDRASLPEIAGDAALLVDPDDDNACAAALERALTDDDLRSKLRAGGPRRAKRFTPGRFAARVLDALDAAIHAGR